MYPDHQATRELPLHGVVRYRREGRRLVEVPPEWCPLGEHPLSDGDLLVGWSGARRYDCRICEGSWCAATP